VTVIGSADYTNDGRISYDNACFRQVSVHLQSQRLVPHVEALQWRSANKISKG
jgi:hypothetical protein